MIYFELMVTMNACRLIKKIYNTKYALPYIQTQPKAIWCNAIQIYVEFP